MSSKNDDNTGQTPKIPDLSALFGDGAKMDVTARDVFGGELSALRQQERRQSGDTVAPTASVGDKNKFNLTQVIIIINLIALTGILIYLLRRPNGGVPMPIEAAVPSSAPVEARVVEPAPKSKPSDDVEAMLEKINLEHTATAALDQAISLKTAETLYVRGDYQQAAYVYDRLRRNLTLRTLEDEALAEWLTLQTALSLQRTHEQELMSGLFTRAINSRSPAVRMLAHYNLAFIQLHNRSYLEARRHAYQALALLKMLESYLPPTVEADLYFAVAEATTRYLLRINNRGDELPGTLWSDMQTIHTLPISDQQQLSYLLTEGIELMSRSAVTPRIAFSPDRSVGSRWSAFMLDGPLDELLKRYAAASRINMNLGMLPAALRQRRSTIYLPLVDRNYLAEVAVGSAGFLWRFDGHEGQVIDLAAIGDTDTLRVTLANDAIALWQRFLLRYRGDHRMPNAHFCLGQLYTLAEQMPTALGEYKLLATQYANNPLAPYGLLSSSKIKTDMRDYQGAQIDLNELLIRYPNSNVVDDALLHLAEATMKQGNYAEASEMFQRVYHLDVNQESRRRATFGLGRCAYARQQYEPAVQWLNQALGLMADQDDSRFTSGCLMLGQAYIQIGRYAEAAQVLRVALGQRLGDRDYVRIILELAEARILQEAYLEALNLLESIPSRRLNQDDSVEVMLARARLYRMIDVPGPAISLLRRQIEFIAESRLRARLLLELAECYLHNGELTPARRELNEAMAHLPGGYPSRRAGFLLAQIAYRTGNVEQAETLCLDILRMGIQDETLRAESYELLGAIYTAQQAYERAALAYAGIVEPTGQ